MVLFLNNADQVKCGLDPLEAMESLARGLTQFQAGDAVRRPRIDNIFPTSRDDEVFNFSSMEGGVRSPGYYAMRIKPDIFSFPEVDGTRRMITYCSRPGMYGGLVFLFSIENAELLAIFNDGYVHHLRVATTGGLGIRYLSRPDSRVLGVYGSGGMARMFPVMVAAVRPIERLQVFSPNRERLERYCDEMRQTLGCEVVALDDPKRVASGADIICTCTTSLEPVIQPEWIASGTHLNNVTHWELGPEVCARVDVVGLLVDRTPMDVTGLVDDGFGMRMNVMSWAAGSPEEQARIPNVSLTALGMTDRYPNARVVQAVDWITGEPYSRAVNDVTILANASYGTPEGTGSISAGIQGIQFATIAGSLYKKAVEKGIGTSLPTEMFLQDIPT